MSGWFKHFRKMTEWEWRSSPLHFSVFCYCLERVNFKDQNFKGCVILAGSFPTSHAEISQKTGLSTRQVRRCLDDLKRSGELVTKSSRQGTIITVKKWELYQSDVSQMDTQTALNGSLKCQESGQLNVRKGATIKKDKKDKNDKNEKNILTVNDVDRVGVSWNNLCDAIQEIDSRLKLARVIIPLNEKRRKQVSEMLKHFSDDEQWKNAMKQIASNEFNLGKNDRGWKANFDWFIRPSSQNYLKYYEDFLADED